MKREELLGNKDNNRLFNDFKNSRIDGKYGPPVVHLL